MMVTTCCLSIIPSLLVLYFNCTSFTPVRLENLFNTDVIVNECSIGSYPIVMTSNFHSQTGLQKERLYSFVDVRMQSCPHWMF